MPFFPPPPFPSQFQKIVLIFDVDGVIREGTESAADSRVVKKLKKLLQDPRVYVVFLSGTPISNNPHLETWRLGNKPLTYVFGTHFKEEIQKKRVWIYGMLGGHEMKEDGSFRVVESFSLNTNFSLGKVLLEGFLEEIEKSGSSEQKQLASDLKNQLTPLLLADSHQAKDETPKEFGPIAEKIREGIDPDFRLISSGGIIETQVFTPSYDAKRCFEKTKALLSQLALSEPHYPATGLAKRENLPFHFLLISRTHKGKTAQALIEENRHLFPEAFIITVGDTQIDFPMHERANLAFHVGAKEVFHSHPLDHCSLVLGNNGEDKQHTEGTLQVLDLVEKELEKK